MPFCGDGCCSGTAAARGRLAASVEFDVAGRLPGKVSWPVRDMAHVPVLASRPMRGFTWRSKQRHRPGLEVMASTGRTHGFESLEEMRLLVALDFLGASEVLSQPFRLDFEHAGGDT